MQTSGSVVLTPEGTAGHGQAAISGEMPLQHAPQQKSVNGQTETVASQQQQIQILTAGKDFLLQDISACRPRWQGLALYAL